MRLLGGSLGLILAIALTSPSATEPVFDRSAAGYVLLLVWLVAWFIAGYSVMPHITVEPARRMIEAASDLSAGEFVAAIIGLTVGLLLGLLLGLPLANFPDPYGWLLPLGVSVVLGLGMMGLTVAKRDDLLDAARDVGLLRAPEARTAGDGDAELSGPPTYVDTAPSSTDDWWMSWPPDSWRAPCRAPGSCWGSCSTSRTTVTRPGEVAVAEAWMCSRCSRRTIGWTLT